MPVQTQIQSRRGTASSWTSTNPTLAAGEFGFETDTGKFKIGTGSSTWNALPYAGSATANTFTYNATAGQTTFSGADANGLTLAYTVGSEQVYLNGVLLVRTSDYTASTGTSIVLASGALASDVLTVVAYAAFTVSSDIAKSTIGAKGDLIVGTAASTPGALTVGADGSALVANSAASGGISWSGQPYANPVLNSNMSVWQRGTSVAVSGASTLTFAADRWGYFRGAYATGMTVSRQSVSDSTNLPNIQYCARVQRDSGNTSTQVIYFGQNFETINSIAYAGKTVTFSFYARAGANYSSASNSLVANLISGTGTDQSFLSGFTSSANVVSQTATLTTTWQRFVYTGTVATTATQLAIYFNNTPVGTASTNDYYEITGVQIDLGSVALPYRSYAGTYQAELAACQRYYSKSYDIGTAPATNLTGNGVHYSQQSANVATGTNHSFIKFPVNMRTAPVVTIYSYTSSTAGAVSTASTTDLAANSGIANRIGESGASIYNNSGGTINVAGNGFIFHWIASAEL